MPGVRRRVAGSGGCPQIGTISGQTAEHPPAARAFDRGGVFDERQTRPPEWLAFGTGFFGMKRVLGPLAGAQTGKEGVTVRYAKDQVKDSPDIDADTISSEQERQLYSYYAIPHGTSESGLVLPVGDRDHDRQVDLEAADRRAVTRHEEELRVGKREVDAGRLRLRTWVETEQVEVHTEKAGRPRAGRRCCDGGHDRRGRDRGHAERGAAGRREADRREGACRSGADRRDGAPDDRRRCPKERVDDKTE